MKNRAISVIGQGFVGGSLTTVFAERGFKVFVYDKAGKVAPGGTPLNMLGKFSQELSFDPSRLMALAGLDDSAGGTAKPSDTQRFAEECEKQDDFSGVYFVCLPTPMREDGSADLSIVENTLLELSKAPGERIAVIKSTVPPGSTELWNTRFEKTGLRVVFNPEFLREASALDDMRTQDRIILGGPRPHINRVKELFQAGWPGVKIIKTSSSTAEMVKYVTNIHLAVKVALANEFCQICEALDNKGMNIDYDKVIEYATMDKRLGTSHWAVPGPMPADDGSGKLARGFAGSCFVKDINALIAVATHVGVKPTVMLGAWAKNLEVRPARDWEKLIGRAVSEKKKEGNNDGK